MHKNLAALLIFLLTLWSCAAVPQLETNDQVTTRMALALAIVNEGSVEIGHFAALTGDKATFEGHVYADKTPGHPLLAVPLIALNKALRQAQGRSTNIDELEVFYDYLRWATTGVNCLFAGLAAAAMFLTALRLGASPAAAMFAAFTTAMATPFYGWSTAFFAHSLTGSLLVLSLALSLRLFPPLGEPVRRPAPWLLLLGLMCGYTAVVDLTALPALAIVGVFTLYGARRAGHFGLAVLLLGIGGVVGLLPLGIYNHIAFGSPLHLGYGDTEFSGMQRGLYGITLPDPGVLFELLFGLFRGLLPLAPILVLVPAGLAAMFRRPKLRPVAVTISLIILAYLWINSSYYYWNGGWSTGPRHLVAMLPVAGLSLAFAWPKTAPMRVVVFALLAVSLVMSLASALAGMFAPDTIPNALTGWIFARITDPVVAVRAILVVPAWLCFGLLWSVVSRTGSAADPRPVAA